MQFLFTEDEVYHNTRIKEYPTYNEVTHCNRKIFRSPGYEELSKKKHCATDVAANSERSRLESIRRAKRNIYDIAMCSGFTHFVTLTLNKEVIDRYDYDSVMKKFRAWLSNSVERRGLSYVLIPEFHKDKAIHFHGFFKSAGDMKYIDSGKRTKQKQKIYNIGSYKFGFTTAIEICGNYEKMVRYVCKYITKSSEKIGGRWYLSGGDIEKPKVILTDSDFDEHDCKAYNVPNVNVSFKYRRIEKGSSLTKCDIP